MTDQHEARAREVLARKLREQDFHTIADDVLNDTYETYSVPRNITLAAMLTYADERTAALTAEVERLREALEAAEQLYQRGLFDTPAEEIRRVHELRRVALNGGAV